MRQSAPAVLLALLLLVSGSAAADSKPRNQSGDLGVKLPDVSPDGSRVAFTLHGDIWEAPVDGGKARRLTLHEAYDLKPRFSPDGKWIAFTSPRNGNYDIWLMSSEGGKPRQLTFHSATDMVSDWSPDGKHLLFYSSRAGRYNLFELPIAGGTPRQITFGGGIHGAYSADGETIVFAAGAVNLNIRQYRGSSNYDLYLVDRKGGIPRPLTDTDYNERNPQWSRDGKSIYHLAEDGDTYGIWSLNLKTKKSRKLKGWKTGDAMDLRIGPEGKRLYYERNFVLQSLDIASTEDRIHAIETSSDSKGWTREKRTLTEGAQDPAWSADGTQITFSLRGDIWIMPAEGGKARRITAGSGIDRWPRFSPNGKIIAFFSNRSGNNDLWLVSSRGGRPRQLTKHKANDFFHDWSPDGRELAFCSERSGNRDIWIVPVDGGTPTQFTKHPGPDDDPAYSPDGEWIAYDSGRSGNQDIWVVGRDGKGLRQVTTDPGQDQVPSWSPDGKLICFDSYRNGKRGCWVIASAGGPDMQLSPDGNVPTWSPRGDKIAFEAERDGKKQIWQIAAPKTITVGAPIPFVAEITVDRKREFVQVFQEAWASIRNGFYDPKLHGVDWKKVYKRYKPLAEACETQSELHDIIRRMLGELEASHMGISGINRRNRVRTGYLGCGLRNASGGKGMVIEEIVPNGPASKAWLREGDVLLKIGKHSVGSQVNLYKLLANKVGRHVTLIVAEGGDREKLRKVKLKPVSRGRVRYLKYQAWIKKNRERTAAWSRGQVGYIHLNAMNQSNLNRFRTALMTRLKKKKALVLDVRNNGGGNIHQQLLDILSRKPYAYFHSRGGKRRLQETPVWDKPVVVIINERSFSDAEIFPHGFQAMGLGKLVGVPTAGGVIGTSSVTLSDGSVLRMPRVGWYSVEGKNLEGWGIEPDIHVEITRDDRRKNRDPQLKTAVKVVIEELKPKAEANQEGNDEEEETKPTKVQEY